MAVLRRSRNGKIVLFIDDGGNVFFTSTSFLRLVLDGNHPSKGFVLLKRFPDPVRVGKFMVSPVFDPKGLGGNGFSLDNGQAKVLRELEFLSKDVSL